jgi:hypothetical protein
LPVSALRSALATSPGDTDCQPPMADADLYAKQITRERTLIALMFLLQPEVILAVAAY